MRRNNHYGRTGFQPVKEFAGVNTCDTTNIKKAGINPAYYFCRGRIYASPTFSDGLINQTATFYFSLSSSHWSKPKRFSGSGSGSEPSTCAMIVLYSSGTSNFDSVLVDV